MLFAGGCGYKDSEECELREIQKCEGVEGRHCQNLAEKYCRKFHKTELEPLSKEAIARKDRMQKIKENLKEEEEVCKEEQGIFEDRCASYDLFLEYWNFDSEEDFYSQKREEFLSTFKVLQPPKKATLCKSDQDDRFIYLLWGGGNDAKGLEVYDSSKEELEIGFIKETTQDEIVFTITHSQKNPPSGQYEWSQARERSDWIKINRKNLGLDTRYRLSYNCSVKTVESATEAIKKEIKKALDKHDELNKI